MAASPPSTTATYDTAVRNMLLYSELMRVLRVLRAAGIPVIVLKGAALAERYRLPGRLRPYLACLWHPAVVLAQGAAAAWSLAARR